MRNLKKIAIYGAGGLGREVACLINKLNKQTSEWNFIGFFDDCKVKGTQNEYGKILGGIGDLNYCSEELAVVIAISSPKNVQKIAQNIVSPNIYFPNIISPDVTFHDRNNVKIGQGNIISSSCLISCNVRIGNFNIFNGFIPVGHDVQIGNFNSIMPSVKISGEVIIGDRNFLGVNSVVLQQVKIGNDITVGANSLIIRNTKDGMTYMGSPASIMKY